MSDVGDWDWQGEQRRGFDFPDGRRVGVSKPGRARLRYNGETDTLQVSTNTGAYEDLPGGGSSTNPSLTQATFYIDAISGDDTNAGDTPATALATFAEYARRINNGNVAILQTVNILTSLSENIELAGNFTAGCIVQGQDITTLLSGTLTGGQAWDSSTTPVTDGQIEDSGVADWSPYIGKKVKLTSGANSGAYAFILDDLGSNTARTGPFYNPSTFGEITPTAGDDYEVVDMTQVESVNSVGSQFLVDNLDVNGAFAPLFGDRGNVFSACIFGSSSNQEIILFDGSHLITGCLFDTRITAYTALSLASCCFLDCIIDLRTGSRVDLSGTNPGERNAGQSNASSPLVIVDAGAVLDAAAATCSIGLSDFATASQGAFRINDGGTIAADAAAQLFTVDQTNGFGLLVERSGLVDLGGSGVDAADVLKFDVSGSGEELSLGSVTTDVAALSDVIGVVSVAKNLVGLQTGTFAAEFDNGNSGGAAAIDFNEGQKQRITLTANSTFTFTDPLGPGNFILKLIQDGTGSRTVTWPAAVLWPSGTAPTLSTAGGSVDLVSLYFDGTNYYASAALEFS